MKQEFNWAMDQVRLPPEAEERILRALEKKQSCFRRRMQRKRTKDLQWRRIWRWDACLPCCLHKKI